MELVRIPIVDFFKHSMQIAEDRGFVWVMCLLAREADSVMAYEDIKRFWYSLDDLTGNVILFVFAGMATEDDRNKTCLHHRSEDYRAIYNPSLRIVNEDTFSIPDYRYPKFDFSKQDYAEIAKDHTRSISELRDYFGLTEKETRSLVLKPTNALLGDRKPITIPLDEGDLYGQIKRIFIALEEPLGEYQNARNEMKIASEDRDLNKKEIEQLTKLSSMLGRYRNARIQLELRIDECFDNRVKEALISAMANCSFENWNLFDRDTKRYLNQYIDLQKNEPNLQLEYDLHETRLLKLLDSRKEIQSRYENAIRAIAEAYLVLERSITKIGEPLESSNEQKSESMQPLTLNFYGGSPQINNVFGESTIIAPQYNAVYLEGLIESVRQNIPAETTSKESDDIVNYLKAIKDELQQQRPKKNNIHKALDGLKAIKATTEFGAAVTALVQFITPFL